MTGIPSDIAGSALQAGYAQRAAARVADGARAGQAQATERQLKAASEAAGSVETTDDDERVYADAEGAGGQGRMFSEEAEQAELDGDPTESPGETDETSHLDIQA
ncbi:MAG: hypothetical protein GY842_15715 [bacterium]|nr:hypothetical protein [bacterium]